MRRWLLLVLLLVVGNSILSQLLWRLLGAKRRAFRRLVRIAAGLVALVNLAVGAYALFQLWRMGWDWFYLAMLLLGFVFVFRFGGATSGSYR